MVIKIKKVVLGMIAILLLCGCSHPQCKTTHTEETNCVRYDTYVQDGKVKLYPHTYKCEKEICDNE